MPHPRSNDLRERVVAEMVRFPGTPTPHPQHRICPYLPHDLTVNRPNYEAGSGSGVGHLHGAFHESFIMVRLRPKVLI